MVLSAVAGAAGVSAIGAGKELFGYNRENFLYDRKMRQETEYQIMDFRIKQAELWREDVRDIIGLTSVKMDTYLIVNAVQLGFTVMAFCEGRLAAGNPPWLVGCHTLSLAGAFMYLLMSVWFSMHASVTAKSYEVRLLTQLVRLPVPSWSQLEGARTYASSFEKVNTKQMFRVPFAFGTQENVLGNKSVRPPFVMPTANNTAASGSITNGVQASSSSDETVAASDLWGLEARGDGIYELDGSIRANPDGLRHLQLIQNCMQYWQSYDGFARVAMSMGTNQLVTALSYYVISYVLISNKAVMAAFLVVFLFMVIATALIRLDMSLTGLEFRAAVVLVFAGPCITAMAAQQWALHTTRGYETVNVLAPMPYAFSAAWLMLLLYISKVGEQEGGAMLPTGFRSVMYIDVFGWIKRVKAAEQQLQQSQQGADDLSSTGAPPAGQAIHAPKISGFGPAVQAVQFQRGVPVATRPEQLPGAAQSTCTALMSQDMFDPTTFVPREKEMPGRRTARIHEVQPYLRPGYVPWRIFCSATSLLVVLWWCSGVFILLQASGFNELIVAPLLTESPETANTPTPIHDGHGAMFLLEHEVDKSTFTHLSNERMDMLVGEHVKTNWPHGLGTPPRTLACGLNSDGAIVLTASNRFGLFSAKLGQVLKTVGGTTQNLTVDFQYAPACEPLTGEALQDVSVTCGGEHGDCTAFVLHHQGQRLSRCNLSPQSLDATVKNEEVMFLSDGWLGEGDAAAGRSQEEVASIALAGKCSDSAKSHCAYIETTKGRLVELKTGLSKTSIGEQEPDWYPTRILLADVHASEMKTGGLLEMISGRFLGVLAKSGSELRALSLREGGHIMGRWTLPKEQRWTSMCSAAGSLFLLAEGSTHPQLWRFPLPSVLQPVVKHKPRIATAMVEEVNKVSGRRSSPRQQHLKP